MTKTVTLDINMRVGTFKAGDSVRVPVNENGVLLDQFWRRRLKDAERDNCVTIRKESKKVKTPQSEIKND